MQQYHSQTSGLRISNLNAFQKELAAWAAEAIHPDANHLKKLQEELDELKAAPDDASEMADIFLALTVHASSVGVNLHATVRKYKLQAGLAAWASRGFHPLHSNLNGIQAALNNLNIAPDNPERIIWVLVALVTHSSVKRIDLFAAARRKLEIVKLRTYGSPDDNGICRHVPLPGRTQKAFFENVHLCKIVAHR